MTHGMVKDIISKIKKPNNELNLIGKAPGAKKPFLHISDACNTILFAIKNQLSGAYNVAPNDNIFVEDVANLIMAKLGIFKKIVWDGSKVWTGDNPVLKCSHNKINLAGFKLEYESSEEAIIAALNESL
jgi:nucleoside-diphosphate-sugar epimerase